MSRELEFGFDELEESFVEHGEAGDDRVDVEEIAEELAGAFESRRRDELVGVLAECPFEARRQREDPR